MKVIETPLEGVVVLEPNVFRDDRGFFLETYNQGKLTEQGFIETFVQDNHSLSTRGTLRGIHAQRLEPQGKLVRATEGEIFDIAVDLRLDSPTYRHWYGLRLNAENFLQLFIPPGFGHGFSVLSDRAQVQYKCTALYNASDEISIRWDDPSLVECSKTVADKQAQTEQEGTRGQETSRVNWRLGDLAPVLSDRDARAPLLEEVEFQLQEAPAYRIR